MTMNRFFSLALRKAVDAVGKPARITLLVAQLANKLKEVNWKQVSITSVREKLSILGRLIKAYSTGEYRDIPFKTILLLLGVVIYFINPIDLIPDMLPLTGFSDDFGVLLWAYNSVNNEIEKFLTWEKSQVIA
jgi:uncharacterized membrane protein YkvA (DUF1232 family)